MLKVWVLTLMFSGGSGQFATNHYNFKTQHDCLVAQDYVYKKYEGTGYHVAGFCLQTDNVK